VEVFDQEAKSVGFPPSFRVGGFVIVREEGAAPAVDRREAGLDDVKLTHGANEQFPGRSRAQPRKETTNLGEGCPFPHHSA
jgi:hypothetical protein